MSNSFDNSGEPKVSVTVTVKITTLVFMCRLKNDCLRWCHTTHLRNFLQLLHCFHHFKHRWPKKEEGPKEKEPRGGWNF